MNGKRLRRRYELINRNYRYRMGNGRRICLGSCNAPMAIRIYLERCHHVASSNDRWANCTLVFRRAAKA